MLKFNATVTFEIETNTVQDARQLVYSIMPSPRVGTHATIANVQSAIVPAPVVSQWDDVNIIARNGRYAFTAKDIHEAFALVEPTGNWKKPIDATVELKRGEAVYQLAAIHAAIVYLTGSEPDIDYTNNSTLSKPVIHVRAKGYNAPVGRV